MKKLLITSLSAIVLGMSVALAGEVPVQHVSSSTNECGVSNTFHNYYLVGEKTVYPYDRFYNNSKDVRINTATSLVKIWTKNGVLTDCDDWYLLSNVVPKKTSAPGGAYIWESQCKLNIPNYTKVNNPTQIDAQINYTVGYNNIKNAGGTLISGKFFYQDYVDDVLKCYSTLAETPSVSACSTTNLRYGNGKIHTGECVNVRVYRCGDGLVNGYNGATIYEEGFTYVEQCDPNDPNHTNWGVNGCTPTCQRDDTPVIPEPAPTCNITLSADEIDLGESATISYWISGAFNSPTYMEVSPSLTQGAFPYTIYCDTANNCQFTQGSTTIAGTSIPGVGTYTFWISGQSPNGDFSCQATLHVKSGSTPPPASAPTCNITLSANEINLGESATINYWISGAFNSPTYMEVSPALVQGAFPYTIYCNTANNCQFTQGSTTIVGTSIPGVGTYTFWISGQSPNGDFNCQTVLNVVDGPTPPSTGQANVSIEKVLESVGPFQKGDEILYKIVAKNNGDAATIVPIWDEMPEAVTYLTSSIMFVPDVQAQNYTFSTGISNGRFMFRYDNVSLVPGQQAIIYLTGIINDNYIDDNTVSQFNSTVTHFYNGYEDCMYYWTNQAVAGRYSDITQNCAYTYSDGSGDNGSGNIVVSCVKFPKPTMIKYQSVRGMEFTRDQLSVAKNEIITYKVEFGNEYGETMSNVTLFDTMPLCVDYVSSSVHGISGYGFSTGLSNAGNALIYYTGFTLGSGQYGYMIVTGRISDSASCQNVDVYRNDAYLIYSGGYINSFVVAKRPNVLLTKTGDGPHYNLSQPNTFYITVTNNSDDTIYDVALSEVDSWPTFNDCVNYIDWRGSNFTKDPNALIWRYNGNLQPGESINLIISGSIGSNASCVRDYINTVVLTYKDGAGYTYTLDADYPFDVAANELAFLTKVVDDHEVAVNDKVTYTITYTNIGHVDRNTGYTLTDLWPSDVLDYLSSDCNTIATCNETKVSDDMVKFTFNSVLHPGESRTLVLTGKVKKSRSADELKWNTVILDYSTIFGKGTLSAKDYIKTEGSTPPSVNCGNGTLEGNEECDGGYDLYLDWGSGERFLIVNYLDYNRTTLADDDIAGSGYYCNQSCKLGKVSHTDDAYNIPTCLNVDTAISIMENEIFPFWWRIWQRKGIKLVNGGDSKNCSSYSTSENTVINKDSMKCTFSVYDGKHHKQSDSKGNTNSLNTFTVDCFMDDNSSWDTYFHPFNDSVCAFSWCVDFDNVAARQAWSIPTLLGPKRNHDPYGEYKLALEHVEYQYCSSDGTWKSGALYDAVCEVDFALTKPYLMQINTAGTPTATTSDFLDKFRDIAGHVIDTDLSDVIKTNQNGYKITEKVRSQINQFKNKYEKLAVTVNNSSINGTIKKVPNQSIYFIKGSGPLRLTSASPYVSKPYTIYVDGMDVIVDGSITTNGMIITTENISFEDTNCTSGGQVVQGIFIAMKGFEKGSGTLNNSIDRERCHWGNLYIRGALIGDNINRITNGRRSQLNSWFETERRYKDTSELRSERRNEIIRGASLLIEYNSNVWSKTIPGAEIFTETLDVYRK